MLVLAIAGLIFLMVFIALPALQRSQRWLYAALLALLAASVEIEETAPAEDEDALVA